ncbi:hypothetical protein IT397_01985, partial [Candidatus Nomurabacteria bacterium]|nr:hypothetical protein [Candidatus Nomurabacteria bacterium]
LETSPEANVTHGEVFDEGSSDSIIYNLQKDKLVVTMDLDGFVVVNTDDVVFVTKKSSVPKITNLVKSLRENNYEELT